MKSDYITVEISVDRGTTVESFDVYYDHDDDLNPNIIKVMFEGEDCTDFFFELVEEEDLSAILTDIDDLIGIAYEDMTLTQCHTTGTYYYTV